MDFQDVLNAVCKGDSDNKTSKKLNVSRITFSRYRNGHVIPSDEVLDKMIEISGLEAMKVYYAAYAEKIRNPKVADEFRHLASH
ncbi:MAG: helix-turn-helix transcriptional regulator [Alteromonadaceae bacterium]|nr:helix-turn-helix transcriptional regulator [Alteromonadaceae bacterium]